MPVVTSATTHLLPAVQNVYYFQNWEYSFSQAQRPLTLTLGLVLALVALYLAYAVYRRWFFRESLPFAIQTSDDVARIINQSIHERATYEVQFHAMNVHRSHFSCSPLEFDPVTGLTLEVSGYIQPQTTWIGREVTCYFKIATGRKEIKWSFFHFPSTIIEIRQKNAMVCIVLHVPDHLERKQRRAHLRLEPPSEDIPEISLWPETLSNLDNFENQKPLLSYFNGRPDNDLNILNISAGGLLLEIRAPLHTVPQEVMNKGNRFFVNLFLHDSQSRQNRKYQLLAQVRNFFVDPISGNRLAGFSFTAILPVTKAGAHPRWVSLEGKGVEDIEDWVFRRHLQIYRQKGLV